MKMGNGNELDEKLSEALSQAVLSETESLFAGRDAFQNWLEKGAQRQCLARRRKIRRIGLAAAAVLLCAVLLSGSLLLSDALPPSLEALLSPWEGMAVPGSDSDITYENGSIVIGGDGNGNVGTWTATFASYDDIPEKYREQIVWFEEMPEGYELESVEITRTPNDEYLTLTFCNRTITVMTVKQRAVAQNMTDATILYEFDSEIEIGGYIVYRKTADYADSYAYICDNNFISLFCFANEKQEKIEAMIASTRTGLKM